jgi:hypothetical protein
MEIFTETSNAPYDRHTYSIVLKDETILNFEHWDDVREHWFMYNQIPDYLDYVVVHSKKKEKSQVKGFGNK